VDSDQYGCLATGNYVDPPPSPWVDQSTPTGTLILISGMAGLCMAATVAVITGLGMTRLLLPPVKSMTKPESALMNQPRPSARGVNTCLHQYREQVMAGSQHQPPFPSDHCRGGDLGEPGVGWREVSSSSLEWPLRRYPCSVR
jgi:hypothetical protein